MEPVNLTTVDIRDEIAHVTEDISKHEQTRDTILRFPENVYYDCMVPLSKVAFSPGRLVHTNEFTHEANKHESTILMSHVDAATKIDASIISLKEKLTGLQAAIGNISHDAPASTVKTKISVEKGSPMSSPSPLVTTAKQTEEEVVRPIEIREFCSDDGQLLDAQVVDMSSEFKSAGHAVAADRSAGTNAGGVRPGKELRDKDGNVVTPEQIYQRLKDALHLPDGGGAEDSGAMDEVPEETNEDKKFIRELANIRLAAAAQMQAQTPSPTSHAAGSSGDQCSSFSEKLAHSDDDDLLRVLEDLEEAEGRNELISQPSAEPARKSCSNSSDADKSFLTSKQWKKGFLGSGKNSSTNGSTRKKPAKAEQRSNDEDTKATPAISTSHYIANTTPLSPGITSEVPARKTAVNVGPAGSRILTSTTAAAAGGATISTPMTRSTPGPGISNVMDNRSGTDDSSGSLPSQKRHVSRFKASRMAAAANATAVAPSPVEEGHGTSRVAGVSTAAFNGTIVEKG